MVVKIDNIQFTASNTFFMDYLICNCLRSVTPVVITVSNIHIKSVFTPFRSYLSLYTNEYLI